jgi:hypothetical protein
VRKKYPIKCIVADYSLVESLEELVNIMEAQEENIPNEHGLAWCQELSEKIIGLLSCDDVATQMSGARILILLMSHGRFLGF